MSISQSGTPTHSARMGEYPPPLCHSGTAPQEQEAAGALPIVRRKSTKSRSPPLALARKAEGMSIAGLAKAAQKGEQRAYRLRNRLRMDRNAFGWRDATLCAIEHGEASWFGFCGNRMLSAGRNNQRRLNRSSQVQPVCWPKLFRFIIRNRIFRIHNGWDGRKCSINR